MSASRVLGRQHGEAGQTNNGVAWSGAATKQSGQLPINQSINRSSRKLAGMGSLSKHWRWCRTKAQQKSRWPWLAPAQRLRLVANTPALRLAVSQYLKIWRARASRAMAPCTEGPGTSNVFRFLTAWGARLICDQMPAVGGKKAGKRTDADTSSLACCAHSWHPHNTRLGLCCCRCVSDDRSAWAVTKAASSSLTGCSHQKQRQRDVQAVGCHSLEGRAAACSVSHICDCGCCR